jgi:hypothetical protein
VFKKVLIAVSAVVSLSAAAQASRYPYLHILECRDARHIADAGYMLNIDVGPAPNDGPLTTAKLQEQSLMGPQFLASYEVNRTQSDAIGAPVTYRSKNAGEFELTVQTTATPVHGGHSAHMVAEVNGERVVADLVCHFLK